MIFCNMFNISPDVKSYPRLLITVILIIMVELDATTMIPSARSINTTFSKLGKSKYVTFAFSVLSDILELLVRIEIDPIDLP